MDISKLEIHELDELEKECQARRAHLQERIAAEIRASLEAQAEKAGLSLRAIVNAGRGRRRNGNGKAEHERIDR